MILYTYIQISLLFSLIIILNDVYPQDKIKRPSSPDTAFIESVKTEIHPDRYKEGYPASIRVKYDFVYGVVNGRDLKSDIFTPKIIPDKPRPAIVFLHGGSWMFGHPSQFHTHAAYLTEKYDELSSIQRIHKDVPPILFLHGTEDKCVSHEQSLAFYNQLKKLGIHAEIELYEGKPHAWFNSKPDKTIVLRTMEKFLVEQFDLY